jgi:hypothetical protein
MTDARPGEQPPPRNHCYSLACDTCGTVVGAITEGGTVKKAWCWKCGKDCAIVRELTIKWFEDGRSIQFKGGDR